MSNRPWMPFYVGDYLKGTGHLSGAEHGAYLLLMFHYWDKGSIPTDDKRLARIAKMTDKQWQSSRETIAEFFEKDDRSEFSLADAALGRCGRPQRPAIPLDIKRAVYSRDGRCCVYCKDENGPFELDHVIAWSRGGEDTEENLVVACRSCNLLKGAMSIKEWLK